MKNEIIEVIAEQLANEFPLYEGNIYEVATRIYNIMKLEDPKEVVIRNNKWNILTNKYNRNE